MRERSDSDPAAARRLRSFRIFSLRVRRRRISGRRLGADMFDSFVGPLTAPLSANMRRRSEELLKADSELTVKRVEPCKARCDLEIENGLTCASPFWVRERTPLVSVLAALLFSATLSLRMPATILGVVGRWARCRAALVFPAVIWTPSVVFRFATVVGRIRMRVPATVEGVRTRRRSVHVAAAVFGMRNVAIHGLIVHPAILRTGRAFRPWRHCAASVELARARRCGDFRTAVIHRCQERAILARRMLVLHLRVGRFKAALAERSLFFGPRTNIDSPCAPVEADATDVVVDHRLVVDVSDVHVGDINVRDAAVIEVPVTAPVTAGEAHPKISEAVVHATVEAHLRSPVSRMPKVDAFTPAPVARGPKHSGPGSHHPRSRNPVVAIRSPRPVTGRPDVAVTRAWWLRVHGQDWRRNRHRHEDSGES